MKISLKTAYTLSWIAGITATIMIGLFVYSTFNRSLGNWLSYNHDILYLLSGSTYNELQAFPLFKNWLSAPVPIIFFISLIFSMKGSLGGRFVWLGSLICFITISFLNTILFLKIEYPFISIMTFLSIATLVLSIIAFVGGFQSLDHEQIAGSIELTYGRILKRRGWAILYFLLKMLDIPLILIPTIAVFLDVRFYKDYLLIFIFLVIVIPFLSLYSVYIINIVLLRKNHPLSFVITPILFAMDFVPSNYPYSYLSIFAIILFILFMRDMKSSKKETIESVKI